MLGFAEIRGVKAGRRAVGIAARKNSLALAHSPRFLLDFATGEMAEWLKAAVC